MAHSTNRSIDFAPAWLKLPENHQETKRQETHNPAYSHAAPQPHSHRHSISHAEHHTNTSPHHSVFQRSSSTSNHPHHHHRSGARPHHINSYRSGPPSTPHHPIQLQRSQSTGSYNDNATQFRPTATAGNGATTPVTKPLEEEFPLLCSGPAPANLKPGSTQSQPNTQVNGTAQWRVNKQQATINDNKNVSSNQLSDNLLTSNMSGKVYRAQVKPVKRSNMIPISNGSSGVGGTGSSGNTTIKPRENGEHNVHSTLSSSLDREKRFLQELGWNEDEESDDDCIIPEQDPAKLEQIMMEAKAARQRLLMKSMKSMKSMASSMLPNEDDLPSSSDNSDNE